MICIFLWAQRETCDYIPLILKCGFNELSLKSIEKEKLSSKIMKDFVGTESLHNQKTSSNCLLGHRGEPVWG